MDYKMSYEVNSNGDVVEFTIERAGWSLLAAPITRNWNVSKNGVYRNSEIRRELAIIANDDMPDAIGQYLFEIVRSILPAVHP